MRSTSGNKSSDSPQKRWVSIVVALGLLVYISPLLNSVGDLRINFTASMPLGFYRITPLTHPLKRGDMIAVCPPYSAALLGRERGYLGPGTCQGGVEPLLKLVAAVEGDAVTITDRGDSVNVALLSQSRNLAKDGAGRILDSWTITNYTVHPKMLWLFAPRKQSWDSRYWGPVSVQNVIGLASPILVLRI